MSWSPQPRSHASLLDCIFKLRRMEWLVEITDHYCAACCVPSTAEDASCTPDGQGAATQALGRSQPSLTQLTGSWHPEVQGAAKAEC